MASNEHSETEVWCGYIYINTLLPPAERLMKGLLLNNKSLFHEQ